MKDISVDIGQLVLDGIGIEPRNSRRLGYMTETALGRLLEKQGFPSGLSSVDLLKVAAPSITLPTNAGDGQLADSVARAVYQALVRKR